MKKLLTTLVSLCIVLAASAQQDVVSGRIMGSDSLSVPGVAVVMQTLDSTYINAEVSDADGYFRIRSSVPLCMKNGKPLQPATGENSNPLFRLPELQQVVVSPQASLSGVELPAKYVYDIETQPGRTYSFVQSEKNTGSEN